MKYLITTDVTSVSGSQTWRVEADSKEEALYCFKRFGGEFVEEEIEVTSYNLPVANELEIED